jgi:hypothetical protein
MLSCVLSRYVVSSLSQREVRVSGRSSGLPALPHPLLQVLFALVNNNPTAMFLTSGWLPACVEEDKVLSAEGFEYVSAANFLSLLPNAH